ncbi:MAG TPA: serine/threonine-protein kinase, partial [Ktedonobacteraceae bacterium]|nr:serine/threonine-protein kinase [Ktedonobacteraceae bacterium]
MREQQGPVMNEQRPERFGNYDIIKPIDTGGMGEVYLARQRSAFGRPVALKIIRSDLVHDTTARARFLREAEVSAHLKHEHILPLFEFGEDQGRLFLVTPYIEGGTLARRLQSGPLPLEEARQLFVPLAQAVAYIHRRGVIHRDLKPSNILLDEEDGQVYVRLIDFGIASVQGGLASAPLTASGNEVGTIAYMAPERLNGVAAPSNDIFSLGIILHQMLTGNLPMGDEIDDMPDALRQVVYRCIALRPEDRYATVEDVLKHFERACQLIVSPMRPNSMRLSPMDSSTISRAINDAPQILSRPMTSQPKEIMLEATGQFPSTPPETGESAPPRAFSPGDYSARTMAFKSSQGQPASFSPIAPIPATHLAPLESPAQATPPLRRRRRRSLLPLLSALMAVILLAIAFLAYYGIQTVTTTEVTVKFGPKIVALNERYPMTATFSTSSVDAANAIIPLHGLKDSQAGSIPGTATGQVNCIFGSFGCQTGVSQEDVTRLANQERPVLQANLTQALNQQMGSAGGTKIGAITFNDTTISSNPAVGQATNTVTVNLTEQASVVYYVTADAQGVARQLLARQAQQQGANYVLVSSTVQVGLPKVTGIDAATGKVSLSVAAGGDMVYQFPASQLRAIQNALKGRTIDAAKTYLALQPGVDPGTIGINFTQGSGATLPGDIQHIEIVPSNPSNYPSIQLQA